MATCLHPITIDGVLLPCGKCPVCRQNYRQSLADRYVLYRSLCKCSFFVTLTYDDDNLPYCLPDNLPLSEAKSYDWKPCFIKDHIKLFLKRLRYDLNPIEVKALVTSEFGDQFGRPHYHLCFFLNSYMSLSDFEDSVSDTWHFGQVEVSSLTDSRIAYCVKYALKDDFKHPWFGYSQRKPFRLFPSGVLSPLASYLNDYIYNDGYIRSSVKINGRSVKLDRSLKNNLDPSLVADLKFLNYESNFYDIQSQYMRSKNLHSKTDCFGSQYNDTSFDLDILKKRAILAENKKKAL